MQRQWLRVAALCAAVLASAAAAPGAVDPDDLAEIRLPPGFSIAVWAEVPGARALAVLPGGRAVVVGSRKGAVHAVLDRDGDGSPGRVVRLADGLSTPHGVAWHEGRLYVSEQHRVWRVRAAGADDLAQPLRRGAIEVIHDGLPDERHHGTRDLAFGPDGRLYVAVGSPCNVCLPESPADAILRMAPDGSGAQVYAEGIRNSVGLAFHPATGDLFFTDNGADWMGNTEPPDELNHAPEPGRHFGFPYYGGGRERTDDFAGEDPPRSVTFPLVGFDAHVAALGLHFYDGAMFPPQYRGDAFVAQHGSWNRVPPHGYRVVRVRFDDQGRPTGKEIFAEGWLATVSAWGRPVDVAELPDGSLLVSDDKAGVLYRITYDGG